MNPGARRALSASVAFLRRRWGRLLAGSLLLVLTAGAVTLWWLHRPFPRIRELHARYRQATRGMTLREVQALMGGPGERNRFPLMPYWDEQRIGEDVAEQTESTLSYTVPTFYLPVTFHFSFDKDGKLIAKHRLD